MRKKVSLFGFLFALILMVLSSCEEEASRTVLTTVCYEIDLPDTLDSYKAEVTYYSDFYYATGELKEITLDSSNIDSTATKWLGKRYLSANDERDQEYYISASFSGIDSIEEGLNVRVYFNDSILIDEKPYSPTNSQIEISGTVPDKF